MSKEEKQIPYKKGDKWFQRVLTYETGKGHPTSDAINEVPEATVKKDFSFLFEDDLPPTITINPIALLAENLLADRSVIDKWIGVSPILNAFFSGVERSLSYGEIEALKMIVADDKDNIDNPLTQEVGDKLLLILNDLQGKVKSPV